MTNRRILILGVGGIGGTLAGTLSRHHDPAPDVVCCTRNPAVLHALNTRGYQLRGVDGEADVPAVAVGEVPTEGSFDWVFLATQPPQMIEAARSIAHLLHDRSKVICMQNGLPESRVAEIVGDRATGCIVGFGARMPEPGVFVRTSGGGFTIADDPELATMLEVVGPIKQRADLTGARWSKLTFNCGISTLGTIGGDTLGALIKHRVVRRLAFEIFTEVVQVAEAKGIELDRLAGTLDLNWLALSDSERTSRLGSPRLASKHALLLAVGARYRKLRSSMLAAIERGGEPAVDFLNGEVVRAGAALGIPTPINAAAQACVHAIHRKERTSSMATIRELYRETRAR